MEVVHASFSEILDHLSLFAFTLHTPTSTMPGLGPSLVITAGLALGVGYGAGAYGSSRTKKEIGVLPPPPVEKYDVVKQIPTAGGSAMLQGGFPGMSHTLRIFHLEPEKERVLILIGPTPDIIQRIAYTAAYDRRLKHPAWVRRPVVSD